MLFRKWVEVVRARALERGKPDAYQVLIYDNHSSHFSEELFAEAAANNIIILTIPPHSSHILQPFDLVPAVVWKNKIGDLLGNIKAVTGICLDKSCAPPIMGAALAAISEEHVQTSFRTPGWWVAAEGGDGGVAGTDEEALHKYMGLKGLAMQAGDEEEIKMVHEFFDKMDKEGAARAGGAEAEEGGRAEEGGAAGGDGD